MNITLLTGILAAVASVQAVGYSRKTARGVSQRQRNAGQPQELPNGRVSTVVKAPEPAPQPNVRGGQCNNPLILAAGKGTRVNIYGKQTRQKKTAKKTEKKVAGAVEKKQDQFLPPGLQRSNPTPDVPGWAWQQPTITVTVTRGFDRTTSTTTTTLTQTNYSTNTVSYSSTEYETILVPVESFTTVTRTEYSTAFETSFIGEVTTVQQTETVTEQATITATETVGPIVTLTTDNTISETNWSTELDYSVVATSTSTVPFSTSTVLHSEVTVTEFVEGGPVTVTETTTTDVNAVTTVYDVTTVTDYEVAYETPAFY